MRRKMLLCLCLASGLVGGLSNLSLALASEPAIHFPDREWQKVDAGEVGWDSRKLEEALEYARSQQSSSVVVTVGGRLLAEGHWPVTNLRYQLLVAGEDSAGHVIEDVASLQKSVVAYLVGIAVKDGRLAPGQPVYKILGRGWSNAGPEHEAAITVEHLLSMTSGLDTKLKFDVPAGTRWQYNTNAYSQLVVVLEKVAGLSIIEITRLWLTEKIGMRDSGWKKRFWVLPGMDANPIGLTTSAQDLARFGLLMLAEGTWQGERLASPGYLKRMISPSQLLNPAYGLLWWLNGYPLRAFGETLEDGLIPEAPSDLYAAQGALDRKLYVVPSMNLVVARLGNAAEKDFNRKFFRLLMQASPNGVMCGSCDGNLATRPSRVQAKNNSQYISWIEHIIDDPMLGVEDLSGSDGLSMADLDGDGFEDIVSVHESDTEYDGKPVGHVRIAWGGKDPKNWSRSTLASGHEAAAAEDVALGDVNGDGHVDVVVACELAHLIYFQNPGTNQRTAIWPRSILDVSKNRGSYIRAFLADFDGDGTLEIVAANKGEQNPDVKAAPLNNLSIYHAPKAPLDGSAWREQVLGKVQIPINSEPVDLDGDGDLDVVAGSRAERRILWFENAGQFKFVEHRIQVPQAPAELSITGFNMDYADLNQDGRLDIVSTAWPGWIVLLLQPFDKTQPWSFHPIGHASPDQLVSIRLGDIDSDGDLDVFTGAYSRGPRDRDGPLVTAEMPMGRIAWFENPGKGVLANWPRHDISRRKRGMYDKWLFRDLDADGDLDVLGTRGNSEPYDGVIWLEQVRTPAPARTFTEARPIDSRQMPAPAQK